MQDIAERIDRHVDRSGEHHLWTGATRADGLGMVKVDGRVVTAGRIVWELAHGPVSDDARVLACPDERTCVRLDHLRVDRGPSASPRARGRRAPNGGGSKRRVRPGVWALTVTSGRFDDGSPRRSYRTVRAENATEASRLLADFVAEVRGATPPTTSRELRDLTVDAAIGLYLDHRQRRGPGNGGRGCPGVVHLPEPVSPRCRDRDRKVSCTYRSQCVVDLPGLHRLHRLTEPVARVPCAPRYTSPESSSPR